MVPDPIFIQTAENLGTGAKTLINIYQNENTSYIFLIDELGYNAMEMLFRYRKGNVLLRGGLGYQLFEGLFLEDIRVNGTIVRNDVELENLVC